MPELRETTERGNFAANKGELMAASMRKEGGCWNVYHDGQRVICDESYAVASAVVHHLNNPETSDASEVSEVADTIRLGPSHYENPENYHARYLSPWLRFSCSLTRGGAIAHQWVRFAPCSECALASLKEAAAREFPGESFGFLVTLLDQDGN